MRVTAELLPQRERDGVHYVGSADLDDPVELLALRLQRVAQLGQGGDQKMDDLFDRSDVHRGREGVVRRLSFVDVVVGVNPLRAERLPHQFEGAVGDYFVAVHIGLRPRTGLPDDEREVVVEGSGDDVIRGTADDVGFLLGQGSEFGVC